MYRRKTLSIAIISTLAFANSQALAHDSLNSSESSVERSNRIIGDLRHLPKSGHLWQLL